MLFVTSGTPRALTSRTEGIALTSAACVQGSIIADERTKWKSNANLCRPHDIPTQLEAGLELPEVSHISRPHDEFPWEKGEKLEISKRSCGEPTAAAARTAVRNTTDHTRPPTNGLNCDGLGHWGMIGSDLELGRGEHERRTKGRSGIHQR